MTSPLLLSLLTLLAVIGGAALALRLLRALLRLGMNAAEGTAARSLAEVSARRGDLTGMAELEQVRRRLRHTRRRHAAVTTFWLAALVVPFPLGVVREVYAAASLLWLVPRRPFLARPAPRDDADSPSPTNLPP